MKNMNLLNLLASISAILAISITSCYAQITFEKITLSEDFISEGVSVGDFDKDGHLDVVSGPFLWTGPDFKNRTRIGTNGETSYDVKKYSYYYMPIRPYDVNNDGWLDVPVQKGLQNFYWLENPGESGIDHGWTEHNKGKGMGGESSQFYPLFGTDKQVLIAGYNYDSKNEGPLSWSEFDKQKLEWVWHIISEKKYKHNSHGLGFGDINGNGKNDIVVRDGWFEQPENLEGDPLWKFHEYLFSFNPYNSEQNLGGSHMYVDDVDGDGDGDVIAAIEGHGWGLAWFENVSENGQRNFIPHMIMGHKREADKYGVGFSQLHSLGYVDIDGDGLKDIIAGKRWYAHNGRDPDPDGPALLYWFKQQKRGDVISFLPHIIDTSVGSGCSMEEQKDIDGDGYPDIVTSSKKGTYIFLTRGHKANIQTSNESYQFTELFHQNSLKGWKTYEAKKPVDFSHRWTIQDGTLHAVSNKDSIGHWLVSKKKYKDFILRYEFKLLKGNSGINFTSFFDNEDVQGPQMDMAKKNTGRIYDLLMTDGKYAGKYLNPQTDLALRQYRDQAWNKVEIHRLKNNIKILLNNIEILDYNLKTKRKKGFLAWQLHAKMAMDFYVRNLEISEL